MKITIKKSVDQEIEMPEFPFYVKEGEDICYKIYSEKECLKVASYDFNPSIQSKYWTSIALNNFAKCKIITEEEFKEFYKLVLKMIEKEL